MTERLDRQTEIDPHKEVLVASFDLVNYAKDIAAEDEDLFNALFEMIRDYQQARFAQLKEAS